MTCRRPTLPPCATALAAFAACAGWTPPAAAGPCSLDAPAPSGHRLAVLSAADGRTAVLVDGVAADPPPFAALLADRGREGEGIRALVATGPAIYALGYRDTWRVGPDGATPTERPPVAGDEDDRFDRLVAGPGGSLWGTAAGGLWRLDGCTWTRIGPARDGALAIDASGTPWVSDPEVARLSDGGWQAVAMPAVPDDRWAVAASDTGTILALSSAGAVIRTGEAWAPAPAIGLGDPETLGRLRSDLWFRGRPLVDERSLRVGADGTVVALTEDALLIATPRSPPRWSTRRQLGLPESGVARLLDVDAAGRIWVASANGLTLVDGTGAVAARWGPGQQPGVDAPLVAGAFVGVDGPLPPPAAPRVTTARGQVSFYGQPAARATVLLSPVEASLTFDALEGKGRAAPAGVLRTRTDDTGAFRFDTVPVWSYELSIQVGDTWFPGISTEGCRQRQQIGTQFVCRIERDCCSDPGETDLGRIDLER